MREIKFRVWDKFCGRMNGTVSLGCWRLGPDGKMRNFGDHYARENYVLMQHTGLKDKSGKEIYEGDIVIINEEDDEWADVVVRDRNWLELSRYKNHCVTNISLYEYHKDVRVIGNIYENPNLLMEVNEPC